VIDSWGTIDVSVRTDLRGKKEEREEKRRRRGRGEERKRGWRCRAK